MIHIRRNILILSCLTPLLYLLFSCSKEPECIDLREKASKLDTLILANLFPNSSNSNLDYVKTLLTAYQLRERGTSDVLQNAQNQSQFFQSKVNNDLLLSFAWLGDHQSVLNGSPTLDIDVSRGVSIIKTVKLMPPKEYFKQMLAKHSVVMFSEAHDRIQGRAFIKSILKSLKDSGVEVLALETLNPKNNYHNLSVSSGWFTSEPIFGQLIRDAKYLGFKLVAYEDTSYSSTTRDFNQAFNLYNAIKKADNGAVLKTAVIGGYGHISEDSKDTLHSGMAKYFKRISGVDPLTVNLFDLSEKNASENYPIRCLLDSITHSSNTCPMIISNDTLTKLKKAIPLDYDFFQYYDAYVYFPKTTYLHSRPDWLVFESKKTFFPYVLPRTKTVPILIQAYLLEEVISDAALNTLVPFDQSFIKCQDTVWLALENSRRYYIVVRGTSNQILHKEEYSAFPK